MRCAHTVAEVRAAEEPLLAGLPDGVLMQRAARGLAHVLLDILGGAFGRRVLLLVGPGNNGGDALWAGAYLARRGAHVDAVLLGAVAHADGLAGLRRSGGRVGKPRRRPDVVVDGIVGIGGRPGLRAEAVEALGEWPEVPVVAVDVPSGVDVDTGEVSGPHVRAAVTVTFGTHKVAHLVDPAAAACGVVHLVDIGLSLPDSRVTSLQRSDVARLLPRPANDGHKYTRGVLGVRAGSATYPGAALLCLDGALGLPGMVRFVGDEAVAVAARSRHPEIVGAGRVQAWVVGPGAAERASADLDAALADEVPVLVDADALAAVRGPLGVPAVLTPHAGELAAMLGVRRDEVEARQLEHVRRAAERFEAVVLLKGRRTLIARPDGCVRVNATGVPWLGTAGSGDVLAGLAGALLASGLSPFDAASVGAWVHGAVGAWVHGAAGAQVHGAAGAQVTGAAGAQVTGAAGAQVYDAAGVRSSAGGPVIASEVAAALRPVLADLLRP
ncbi:bifunctional ADP-dependent NAD(P)H-hydrate dehydratase/NAD(P)H-hydrate epimerase [Nocardioides daejeonensis]|uniref:bifunctional ADP-dependent NAD(P)H-hydrate dehydratase/NAD(P)H-hydrate epimerase n=1 Tax=Nocardioides daejeonensis TaxID=1046556 RepID=UPI000D74FBD3|nr:bifunctional ADP-dependent NAD(P)H-hydrate dehydratase/NAD(P)H-hydrate epimerase [Nocardioides daejeonensis]